MSRAGPRLGTQALLAVGLRSLGAASLFAMHAVAGRKLGPEAYGVFSYVLTLLAILAFLAPCGFTQLVVRFASVYLEKEQWGLLRGVISYSQRFTFMMSVLIALGLAVATRFMEPGRLTLCLLYTALLLPCLCFVYVRRQALLGLNAPARSIVPEDILLPTMMMAGLALGHDWTARGALTLYGALACGVALLGMLLLWISLPPRSRQARPELDLPAWQAYARNSVVGTVGGTIINLGHGALLGLLGGLSEMGPYNAANRIAMLTTFVLSSINLILAPRMARAYHTGRYPQYRALLRQGTRWAALGATPPLLLCMLFPEQLLSIFGHGFESGATVLRILVLGCYLNACTGPVGSALQMTGQEHLWSRSLMLTAGLGVVLQLVLIPLYGAVGAASVYAACLVGLNLSLLRITYRILNQLEQGEAQ